MTKLSQSDVLQALAEVEVSGGLRPLAAGLIQDVVIEWHDLAAPVVMHADAVRGSEPPSLTAVAVLAQPVRRLPAVVEVREMAHTPWAFVDGEALDAAAPRGSPAQAAYGQLARAVQAGPGAADQTEMDSGGESV